MATLRAGAAKYASGTIVSQALIVVATPLLTRLYSPAEFGELALFSSVYGIFIHFTTLKFELSILLPKEQQTAVLSTTLAVWICLAFVLLLCFALMGWREGLGLPWQYILLPCALVSGAIFSLAQLWCSREKDFLHIGLGSLINAATNVIFCIGIFFVRPFPGALVAGYTLGLVAAAIYLASIKHNIACAVVAKLSVLGIGKLKRLLAEGRNFPLHVLPNMLLTSLAYQLIPILMAHYFSNSTVGLYSVANRLLYLPSILFAGAFADIFRSELMTRVHDGRDPVSFFRRSLGLLLIVAIPAYLVLWLFSPILFKLFLGGNFAPAGIYARYLCAGVAGNLFVTCFAYVFIGTQSTRTGLVLQIASTAVMLVGFLIGAVRQNIYEALLFMSLSSAFMAPPILYTAYCRLSALRGSREMIDAV